MRCYEQVVLGVMLVLLCFSAFLYIEIYEMENGSQQLSQTKTKIRQQIIKHVKENELKKKIHIFDMGCVTPYQIYNGKIR